MFQALIGGRKKPISPVRYSTTLEGASVPPPENSKCTRRSCREVKIAQDMLLGCLARKYLYVQTKEEHDFCVYQLQKTGAYLIFLSTSKLQELRRPMQRKGQE